MKHKILYIIAAAAAVIATAACNKEKPEDFDPSVLDIKVQPDSLVVKADGGNASFTFNAPDYWFASSPADWVEFEPASGKPGEVTLVVKVPEYHVAQQRSALVTVNAKGHKGQFKVIQEAGAPLPPPPDYSGPWTVIGTIDGSNWDKDFDMSDNGDLVWEAKIPYKEGDEFKFRMNAAWDTNMGIDGDLAGADGSYTCSLKQDGPNIKLPAEGYWNLTLNMNDLTMAAVFDSEFPSPVANPLPSNWEAIWLNDGSHGDASWGGVYRYGLEGNDGNNECVATFPQDIWDRIKSETFYAYISGENPQVRVTDGWWSVNLTAADIQPGNELLKDNGAGTWILELNLSEAEALLAVLDAQHLLLTGAGFTVEGLYMVKQSAGNEVLWQNDGSHGDASWGSVYRYGLEGYDGNNECIATFPQDVWDRLKSETFCVTVSGSNPQIRVTDGWWTVNLTAADIQPGNDLLEDNGDGTWTLTVNLSGATDLLAVLDDHHLLFTGGGFAVENIYFPAPAVIWENDGSHGDAAWGGTYRYGLEGHDGNYECIATFPQSIWDQLKTKTFYVKVSGSNPQIRVTDGWWTATLTAADIQPGNELLADNGDGTWTLTVNLSGAPDFLALLDERHLLFTGGGFAVESIYF